MSCKRLPLVAAYPDARYVVTTRPFAVEEDWLTEGKFVTFDLLPLTAKGVRDFLARWHDAARRENESDDEKLSWLNERERTLAELLSTRSDLRKLSASPLLCGLLCALYQDGNMHLPRDRKSLYEAALDLLLARWDEQRNLTVGPLDKEEQLMLLQAFAYSLVKNSQNSLEMSEATPRFTRAMRGLRLADASPTTVLQHMLERTGVLLEPYPDQVEFVHRTFRDFLAAKEVADCGDYNEEHAPWGGRQRRVAAGLASVGQPRGIRPRAATTARSNCGIYDGCVTSDVVETCGTWRFSPTFRSCKALSSCRMSWSATWRR